MSADEINKIISSLADKLGPLGKVVWEAYVRQQYVIGVQEAIAATVMLIVSIAGALLARMGAASMNDRSADYDQALGFLVAGILMSLAGIAGLLGWGLDSFAHFSNPQYGAVQGLLGR